MRPQRGLEPALRVLRGALGCGLILIATRDALSLASPGVPVHSIDLQVVGPGADKRSTVPLAGVEVIVIPSAATLRALGWFIDTSAPCTPEAVATGAVYGGEAPVWIERGELPPYAVRTHTDQAGRFHADVPVIERPDRSWDHQAGPHILLRADGLKTLDIAWLPACYYPRPQTTGMEFGRTLRGRIVDVEGWPISGAVVTVNRIDAAQRSPLELAYLLPPALLPATALTDATGCFELDGVDVYASQLWIAHRDFVPKSVACTNTVDVDSGEIVLERGRTITGRVIDPGGVAVACALVWVHPEAITRYGYCPSLPWQMDFDDAMARRSLLGRDETVVVRADHQGRFELQGVTARVEPFAPDGRLEVDIHAAAPGFETSVVFDVDLDSDVLDDVLVPLRREAMLDVHVRDDLSGVPVTGVQVSGMRLMWPAGTGDGVVQGEPDGAGSYRVGHAGRYGTVLTIQSPGHARLTFEVPGLAAGELRELEARLAPESSVGGRVTTTSGTPIPGARVHVFDGSGVASSWFNLAGTTDDLGDWKFAGLPAGKISVSVEAAGFASRLEPIDLAIGESRALEMQLLRDARIDVTCPPLKQLAASRRWVQAFREGDDQVGRPFAEENPSGCSFRRLRPGRYIVVSDFGDPVVVDLGEGEVRAIEITPRQHPTVRALLSCAGMPLAGLHLEARLQGSTGNLLGERARGSFADAAGECEIELPRAGCWDLTVHDDYFAHQSWPAGTVNASWDGREIVTIELPGRQWDVEVADGRGRPLAEVNFWLQDAAGIARGLVTSDSRGHLLLDRLAPGSYRLALAGGYTHLGSEQAVPMELSESWGPGAAVLRVVIPRGASVSGAVHGLRGKVPGLRVRAVSLRGDRKPTFSRPEAADRCASVIAGRFDVAGLTAGRYRLLLESTTGPLKIASTAIGIPPTIWWTHAARDVTVLDDEELTADFSP